MAQAPGKDDEGAPRKTTTYNKFEGMESQNERFNVKPNEMFWIENIMRTGPRKLSSVPGPAFRRYFPATLPTICTDATERGQQVMTVVTAFQQNGLVPGGSLNNKTSWSYVSPTGEVFTLNGDPTCGGGNMFYLDACVQINHFIDNVPIVHDNPALFPSFGVNAVNTRIGVSDQPAYAITDFSVHVPGGMRIWYPNLGNSTDYDAPGGYSAMSVDTFAVKGNDVWLSVNQTSGFTPARSLIHYARDTGAFIADFSSLNNFYLTNMNLTSNRLVCLAFNISNNDDCSIKMINTADGSVAQTIDLSNLRPSFLFAVNNSLIYVLCASAFPAFPAKMYYWNGTDVIYVGVVKNYPNNPFYQGSGLFSGGRYYFGRTGFGGFTVDIYSFAIACPPGAPIIASVTAGAGSVAAGATIPVSWANVLEPDLRFPPFRDTISLYPKPAAGKLDYVIANAVADLSTTGGPSGTMSFTIPGGTTPGDYVFRYQAGPRSDAVLVATSPSFTVT